MTMFDLAELDELEAGLSELEAGADSAPTGDDPVIGNTSGNTGFGNTGVILASSRNECDESRTLMASLGASSR